MTKVEARKALYQGFRDGLEAWIAGQLRTPTPKDGWDVESSRDDGSRFHVRTVPPGLWVTALYLGGIQMMGWLVTADRR